MKSIQLFLFAIVFMPLFLNISALPNQEEDDLYYYKFQVPNENKVSSSLAVTSRFLSQKTRIPRLTCNKFPRICHAKGSPGPHCCKEKCVNTLTDRLNCGMCGKKCKYNETCCNGKCVNPSFNRRHCGGCNNRCNNGRFCVFGLCNYA
jgi:hypothetical protein